MMKSRIMWFLWIVLMAGATVYTGSWIFAVLLMISGILLVFSAVTALFCGKKMEWKLKLPRAAQRTECFDGNLKMQNNSIWPVSGSCTLHWQNQFTGEKGEIPLPFSLGTRETGTVGFQAKSNWCGCIEFGFSQWKCRDFFGVAAVKRAAEVSGCTVVMPGEHRQDFSFLTREGFDMESFRYSGSRPGDDPGETYDIREYQPGDSIRQIHWKLTGKLDDIMIREKSYPVDDTVLILAESWQEHKDPGRAETVAEVFASVLLDFIDKKIPCQAGIYDHQTGRFRIQKVRTREDYENVLYLFLRSSGQKRMAVQGYLENSGTQSFANYIYITGDPDDREAETLRQKGQVTVIGCGTGSPDNGGEHITWRYGSQNPDSPQKENTENNCQVSFCRLR